MGTIHNRKSQKEKRQRLRTHMTLAERVLWCSLKGRQVSGYKFRRQHGVKQYILDFYCPELSLAIEADGESHDTEEAKKYDAKRQLDIEAEGIHFLRFRDDEIIGNPIKVARRIEEEIMRLTAHTAIGNTIEPPL